MFAFRISAIPKSSSARISTLAVLLLAGAFASSGSTCDVGNGMNNGNCPGTLSQQPIILSQDHIEGMSNAPVTVVEYADFQCPFCGRFARETFPSIKQNYIDTGKVRWIFRHFPLRNIHPNAEGASQASECASDQNAFWNYHDRLFQQGTSLAIADLKAYASQLGLSSAAFDPCVDGGGKATRVQSDVNSGQALGVTGTPAFFINNRLLIGFRNVADFSAALDCAYTQATGGGS